MSLRPDLQALTPDDLAAFSNRGLVKRAQREIESGEVTATWLDEPDGTVRATWSDGSVCTFPGGKTLKEAQCTCGALEMCRHILRSVLAWQVRKPGGADAAVEDVAAPAPPAPWDPGLITDATIEQATPKVVRDRAVTLWSQGVLVELLRAAKPSAQFHLPGHTIRFVVPLDLRYARCSCPEPAPCVHAILAVRAFRQLPAESGAGIVSEGSAASTAPPETLAAAASCVEELLENGFASLGPAWRDRTRRIATECTEAALIWPAQILEELAEDLNRYTARDAAFAPARAVESAGELLLRLDAIRAGCAPVPQAFIRGLKSDRDMDLGGARFIGLGATATQERNSTSLAIYLQDCDTGHVLTSVREFAEPEEAPRKTFAQLARANAVKDASLASLAAGQLVTQGGRRTAAGKLVIGRARAMVNPQDYSWEQLKAPVLVEDFAELTARLRMLPPASFRPRRAGSDFHVCPLTAIESAHFDARRNAIVGVLIDGAGRPATMFHPWTERGGAGAEELLAACVRQPLFIAGHIRLAGTGLLVQPTALVVAREGGGRRGVLPWIDPRSSAAGSPGAAPTRPESPAPSAHGHYADVTALAVELIVNGFRRTGSRDWPDWTRTARQVDEHGYHRIAALLRNIASSPAPGAGGLTLLKLLALSRDAE